MDVREDRIFVLRIQKLDRMFGSKDFVTTQQIMESFEISERTVRRDIGFLRDRYNAPIKYKKSLGYYYEDKNFSIQKIMITEGELFTFASIFPLMDQYKNTPLENSFKEISKKIIELFPDKVFVNSDFIDNGILFIPDPLPKIEEKVFSEIFKSIKIKKTIQLEYISLKRNAYEKKLYDCYQVICQKGTWYVMGYEHNSKEIRLYAMSRMKNIFITESDFLIPKNFNMKNYVDPYFGIWNNRELVEYEFLFSKEISIYILERSWHPDQEMYQKEDGTVYLKFKSNQKQEIKNWVRSWGELVTVLSPKKLQMELIENAKAVLEKYEKSRKS